MVDSMMKVGSLLLLIVPHLHSGAELQDEDTVALLQNSLHTHPSRSRTQSLTQDRRLEWIIGFRRGVQGNRLDEFCSLIGKKTRDSSCTFQSDPSDDKAALVIVEGRRTDMLVVVVDFVKDLTFFELNVDLQVGHRMHGKGDPYETDSDQIPWNLDRIDAITGLDNAFSSQLIANGGAGVHVYVIDTGIDVDHPEFEGRAITTIEVMQPKIYTCKEGELDCARDKHGHGTFSAALIGGKRFGVAKNVTLHSIKSFMDGGVGKMSWIVLSLDWVVSHGHRPAVVYMGFSAPGTSNCMTAEIEAATRKGIAVIAAAGDDAGDSCTFSPAAVPSAVTVSASTKTDGIWPLGNNGACVDVSAPGENIISARPGNKQDLATSTSSAAALVAGAAALIVREGNITDVSSSILARATSNVLTRTNGVANKLLCIK